MYECVPQLVLLLFNYRVQGTGIASHRGALGTLGIQVYRIQNEFSELRSAQIRMISEPFLNSLYIRKGPRLIRWRGTIHVVL